MHRKRQNTAEDLAVGKQTDALPVEAPSVLFVVREQYRWPQMATFPYEPKGAFFRGSDGELVQRSIPMVAALCNISTNLTPEELKIVGALDSLAAQTNAIIQRANKLTYADLSKNQITAFLEQFKKKKPELLILEKDPDKEKKRQEKLKWEMLAEARGEILIDVHKNYRECGELLAKIVYDIREEVEKWRRGGLI